MKIVDLRNKITSMQCFWIKRFFPDDFHIRASFFFSDKNLNFIGQMFNDNGNIKPWKDLRIEFHFKDTRKIHWLQIIKEVLYLNLLEITDVLQKPGKI